MSNLSTLLGSTIGDAANAVGFGASNLLGASAQIALHKLLAGRTAEGRRIFLAEVAAATRPIRSVHEQDEFVAILYAYQEANLSGAAELNLRLLARVVGGQHEGRGLYASEFLELRSVVAYLSREEIIHLGQLLRVWRPALLPDGSLPPEVSSAGYDPVDTFKRALNGQPKNQQFALGSEKKQELHDSVVNSLVPSVYRSRAEFDSGSSALLRTGLVISEGIQWSGVPSLIPSPRLIKLEALARLDELAQQARNDRSDAHAHGL